MKKYSLPTNCPYCDSTLELDEMHLYCNNEECSGMKFYQFIYGANALNLDFLGEATLEKIFFNSDVKTAFDLLDRTKFNKPALLNAGFSDGKNIDRILDQIYNLSSVTMKQVVLMLSIPGLGKRVSEEVAKKLSNVKFSTFGLEKRFFDLLEEGQPDYNRLVAGMKTLVKNGVTITRSVDDKNQTTFEMTGEPPYPFKTKDDFVEYVSTNHNCKHTSLKKETKYLITDSYDSKTGKMTKANDYKVKIYTYDDFIKFLEK